MTTEQTKPKILAVDDSRVMRKAMTKVLGKEYDVIEAEHGEDAWTILMHDKDIEVVFTGVRPGEKLSEELWDRWAQYEPTSHPDIVLLADEDIVSGQVLRSSVDELLHLAREGHPREIIKRLDVLIPGASVRTTPPPDLTSIS